MTTEPKLPPMPIISGVKHWDLIRTWGLQCFEAGRQQGLAEAHEKANAWKQVVGFGGTCSATIEPPKKG